MFFAALALTLICSATSHAELRAGVARVSLTPDLSTEAVPLGGYTARGSRRATGIRDPVHATALVLSDGRTRVAIVSCDLVTIPASLSEAVLQRLPGWFPHELVLCATHTHCAPDSQRLNRRMTFPVPGIAPFDPKALDWTAERIADAVSRAASLAEPVALWTGSAKAGLSRGRRPTQERVPAEILRARKAPWRTAPLPAGSAEDDRVAVAEFRRPDGSPLAVLVGYAAHPTIFSETMLHISAEWPGELARCWERRYPGSYVLVLAGALGDRSPIADRGGDEDERVSLYARALLARVESARRAARPVDTDGPLAAPGRPCSARARAERVALVLEHAVAQLPAPTPHRELVGRMAAQGIPKGLVGQVCASFAPPSAPVRLLRIGSWSALFVPGEPTTEAGEQLRRSARADMLVALAAEWVGYILTPDEYARGGYEATVSFYGDGLLSSLLAAVEALRRAD